MKLLIIPTLFFLLTNCGIKKELASANQSNLILKERVKELETEKVSEKIKLDNCTKRNSTLYSKNRELTNKINNLQNQDTKMEVGIESSEIFSVVEVMPEYPGGQSKMLSYIGRKVKYPDLAKENNIQGKVYVQFVVNKDGSISDAKVMRGIGGGCDEEALRAVNSMPNWKPGTQRGKPVRTRFVLPVNFRLR